MRTMREDLAQAVKVAYGLSSSSNLWPNWDISDTPIVLHSPETAYVIGHPCPPEGYEEVEPLAGKTVYYGPTLPDMSANTASAINQVLCALISIPAEPIKNIDEFSRLMLHECFHVFQQKELPKAAFPNFLTMGKYPENDPENNALSILENQILSAALMATGKEREALAKDFLTIRHIRQKRLVENGLEDVVRYEEESEYSEGTPTYVEVKAGKPVCQIVESLKKANIGGKGASYRRYYFTGAAMALILDELTPLWHQELRREGSTPQKILSKAVAGPIATSAAGIQMSNPSDAGAPKILERWGYPAILASEIAGEEERKKRIDDMYREITSGAGCLVEIEVPEGSSILFDPTNVVVVKPRTKFHTTLTGLRSPGGAVVDISGTLCLEEKNHLTLRLPEKPEIKSTQPFFLLGSGLTIKAPLAEVLDPEVGRYRIRFPSA